MASSVVPRASRPLRQLLVRNLYRSRSSQLHTSAVVRKSHGKTQDKTKEVGSSARTDESITVEYPPERSLPSSRPVAGTGRAGDQLFPALASLSLQGKVCVVTGGARGLGLVMGQGMVVSGSDLAIVDLNSLFFFISFSFPPPPPTGPSTNNERLEDEAAKQADLIIETFKKENPGAERMPRVTAHYADVSDPASVETCIGEIVAAHGRIDGLVTSAGFTENFEAVKYPVDRMRKLWGVNVDGTYLFATAVARHLMDRKAKGSMVFIGSMSGSIVNVPQPQAPYNASKAAVRHLAASLAVEWAEAGIRVNCISPGYMLTALTEKILDENPDLKQKWTSLIPQGRMGNPRDLMGPVVFLLSDAAGYVTGADLRVDGGYTVT
ncbi:hypothetical protein QBC47DRAFT_123488 [Echria macrotheca]|uniref:Uncharacterized protein n=1 Tax=Echria macrotheca TaxID=438768 RepID=A0AAJ0B3T2_9PEZI|nr:hypothetical protein QBC47DRAFT_123488 [Echria macrotheca]